MPDKRAFLKDDPSGVDAISLISGTNTIYFSNNGDSLSKRIDTRDKIFAVAKEELSTVVKTHSASAETELNVVVKEGTLESTAKVLLIKLANEKVLSQENLDSVLGKLGLKAAAKKK